MDSDEWILEAGDEVILTKEERELTELERFIYMIWVLDYAVRNAGSKKTLKDFPEFKKKAFAALSLKFGYPQLGDIPYCKNDEAFCDTYYSLFEDVICSLKKQYTLKN